MTVPSTVIRKGYIGAGSTDTFAYTWRIQLVSELSVSTVVVATGVITDLVEGSGNDYTVTGVKDANGDIVLVAGNLPSGTNLSIVDNPADTQLTDIANQSAYFAAIHEDTFDHLARVSLKKGDASDRSLKLPQSVEPAAFSMTIPTPLVAGDGWVINSAKDGLDAVPISSGAIAAAVTAAELAETNAQTSETNAATSETNASTSETNSATSATNASTSETNAAASAASINADLITQNQKNVAVNSFRISVNATSGDNGAVDSWTDVFSDETGVDLAGSTNELYDGTADRYSGTALSTQELILNFEDADASTSTTDESSNAHTVTFNGTAETDTAEAKFGNSSLKMTGGTNRGVDLPNTVGDYMGSTDFTMHWNFKFSSATGAQHFLRKDGGADSSILRHTSGQGFDVDFVDSSSTKISINNVGEITDTASFHHVALIKVGSDVGLYVDGAQVGYDTDAGSYTTVATCQIGDNSGAGAFNGWFDGIEFDDSNIFGAAPVVGLSDTITVPTSAPTQTRNNLTLQSNALPDPSGSEDTGFAMIVAELVSGTINTDLQALISRDGGSTFTQVTLTDDGVFSGNTRIYSGQVAITGTFSSYKWQVKTLNNKDVFVDMVNTQLIP